jgi:hypothetical protein
MIVETDMNSTKVMALQMANGRISFMVTLTFSFSWKLRLKLYSDCALNVTRWLYEMAEPGNLRSLFDITSAFIPTFIVGPTKRLLL